jgi:hypothetical protein
MTTKWVPLVRMHAAGKLGPEINETTLHELAANFKQPLHVFANVVDACGPPIGAPGPGTGCWVEQVRVAEHDGALTLMALIDGPAELIVHPITYSYYPMARSRFDGANLGAKLDAVWFASNVPTTSTTGTTMTDDDELERLKTELVGPRMWSWRNWMRARGELIRGYERITAAQPDTTTFLEWCPQTTADGW